MKKLVLLLLLASACSPQQPEPVQGGEAGNSAEPQAPAFPAGGSLTGLYESGPADQPNQLCVVDERFGLVVWGGNLHSCSGTGTISREGDRLRMTMAGDSTCTIDATISGGVVALPGNLPQGCSYYCGARARMDGATFTRKGSTRETALQAKDLVGDPLCG